MNNEYCKLCNKVIKYIDRNAFAYQAKCCNIKYDIELDYYTDDSSHKRITYYLNSYAIEYIEEIKKIRVYDIHVKLHNALLFTLNDIDFLLPDEIEKLIEYHKVFQ